MMKVIADIGSNWFTLDDCLKAVDKCKESGIDIVKFQYFTHEKLYGIPGDMPGQLPQDWIPQIHARCQEQGLEFMCSVFDPDDVDFIDQFVARHKIASSENAYPELVGTVSFKEKPYLVSHGCKDSYNDSMDYSDPNYVPLACISQYPTDSYPIEDLCSFLTEGRQYFGLSDHNLSPYGYELAYRFGCSYYEFHFNPLGFKKTPDACVSRTEFTRYEVKPFVKKPGRKFLRVLPSGIKS